MAVLTREEFISRVNDIIGDDGSDSAISFLEDMTDTYDDLAGRTNTDWEQKYKDLDEAWRKRYTHRFLGGTNNPRVEETDDTEIIENSEIDIDDLFESEED